MTATIDEDERHEDTMSTIPRRFRWATFNSPELCVRVKPPSLIATALYVDGNAVLYGPAGLGKTCLGVAMLRRLSKKLGKVGVLADAIDLAYARRMHPLGKGEAPEVTRAMNAGVLFLDELGAEQGIDQTVEQIIRSRHNFSRPTIIATPCKADEIIARYGGGVGRRIYQEATLLELGGGTLAKLGKATG